MDIEKLRSRLAELTAQRDHFINSANMEIAAANGRIMQLQELIDQLAAGEADTNEDAEAAAVLNGGRRNVAHVAREGGTQ